jgi:hypothetical protein
MELTKAVLILRVSDVADHLLEAHVLRECLRSTASKRTAEASHDEG